MKETIWKYLDLIVKKNTNLYAAVLFIKGCVE
jgi:hypothetical protein